jgi:dTDP-4-dehydrorhamnose reductase
MKLRPKVLVTGANGQLGREIVQILKKEDYETFGFNKTDLDITDNKKVTKVFSEISPDIVIHSAAYTQVDDAESKPELSYLINGIGTRNIAVAAEKTNAKLIYISTDYVFDGTADYPINEYENTNPISIYGKSKYAGEQYVRDLHSKFFIIRTSWVFGQYGKNFVNTMLDLATRMDELKVVNDQVGCPTYTVDLSFKILELMNTDLYGIYHISNSGQCTWYELANYIFEVSKTNIKVNPCTTEDFPRPAPRPSYSVFEHLNLKLNNFTKMRHWEDAVKDYLKEI